MVDSFFFKKITPEIFGEIIQFDLRIFFRWVETTKHTYIYIYKTKKNNIYIHILYNNIYIYISPFDSIYRGAIKIPQLKTAFENNAFGDVTPTICRKIIGCEGAIGRTWSFCSQEVWVHWAWVRG